MSILRAVITPSKGATMRSNDCSSSSRRTFATAEFTWVVVAFNCVDRVVRVLLRDRVLTDQILVAVGRHLRQRGVALRGRQVRLRLR